MDKIEKSEYQSDFNIPNFRPPPKEVEYEKCDKGHHMEKCYNPPYLKEGFGYCTCNDCKTRKFAKKDGIWRCTNQKECFRFDLCFGCMIKRMLKSAEEY